MKILLAEDEHRIAQAIKEGLEEEGFAVDVTYDGAEALASAQADEYDLLILDVMMPEMDGLTVCRTLRSEGNHTPILMLTAKDQATDIVKGLDNGADDYLAKPFAFTVLLARIRALLRRPHENIGDVLTAGDVQMNTLEHVVTRQGKHVALSSKEYAILEYLLRNKNRVLSKNNIMTHVWDFDADILPNNVEVFIAYLRGKLEKPFRGHAVIETVRGFGYIIKDQAG